LNVKIGLLSTVYQRGTLAEDECKGDIIASHAIKTVLPRLEAGPPIHRSRIAARMEDLVKLPS
jgi:hypothetical protein